jgi:hypothetical protein
VATFDEGNTMQTILCVGENSGLLDSRAALLRLTGAEVVCCAPQAAPELIRTSHFDLAVLCHTLQYDQVNRISHAAGSQPEKTSILLLTPITDYHPFSCDIGCGVMVNAEPASLVRATTKLLEQSDQPSLLSL